MKKTKFDLTLSERVRQQMTEQSPIACAVTRGMTHTLIYSNPAFRAVPGIVGEPTPGRSITELFDVTIATRLTELLERASRERIPLRDRFLGPLEPGSRPWSCTVWPLLLDDGPPQDLVIELNVASHMEFALSLQREVAERLLLSALRQSDATEGAEASHQRAAFLATASRDLAESLDIDATRKVVAALTLPPLAEWCIVDLLEKGDVMHRLTIVHRDPAKQALAGRLDGGWSPEVGDPFGVPAVLRNPQPVLIGDVDEALGTAAHAPENLSILRELGIGPLLTVPLIAQNKVFGAITFVSGARELTFSQQDIELAEGLAARSALALENARMYGQTMALMNKAESAAKIATTFLGTISHELRTPLNAIAGYVEVIARGIHGPVTETQRVDLERINSNQRHLLVIVGGLLNFMRVGSGRVTYDAVDVSLEDAGTRAIEALEPLIAKKRLKYRVASDGSSIVASADPGSVHQILINLISNAVKFTNVGGEITIVCAATQNNVAIAVSDNGRGIPADKLELIFEPFVQAHEDDARTYGGVGLGLPISRDLARAMHGDLTVESMLGEGSKFTLILPSRAPTDKRSGQGDDAD